MPIQRAHINEAKVTLKKIDDWFQDQVTANPANAVSLVAQRAKRINEEIYEHFSNQRTITLSQERDTNSVQLSCRAGRGRPFGGVPRDSTTRTVKKDNADWIYDTHSVDVHNDISGSHDTTILPDLSGVQITVRCTGVAFEDTQRGHGAYSATLKVKFKMTEIAIREDVQLERISLQRELGL